MSPTSFYNSSTIEFIILHEKHYVRLPTTSWTILPLLSFLDGKYSHCGKNTTLIWPTLARIYRIWSFSKYSSLYKFCVYNTASWMREKGLEALVGGLNSFGCYGQRAEAKSFIDNGGYRDAELPKVCQIDQAHWAWILNLGIEPRQFLVTQLTETLNLGIDP